MSLKTLARSAAAALTVSTAGASTAQAEGADFATHVKAGVFATNFKGAEWNITATVGGVLNPAKSPLRLGFDVGFMNQTYRMDERVSGIVCTTNYDQFGYPRQNCAPGKSLQIDPAFLLTGSVGLEILGPNGLIENPQHKIVTDAHIGIAPAIHNNPVDPVIGAVSVGYRQVFGSFEMGADAVLVPPVSGNSAYGTVLLTAGWGYDFAPTSSAPTTPARPQEQTGQEWKKTLAR